MSGYGADFSAGTSDIYLSIEGIDDEVSPTQIFYALVHPTDGITFTCKNPQRAGPIFADLTDLCARLPEYNLAIKHILTDGE